MNKLVPKDAILIPDTATRMFTGIIYDVYQWQQPLFDGSVATFEMLRRPDTVTVICIVDDAIVMLEDTQPHRGMRLGLPGGRVDRGEDTLTAARREVREETGYTFHEWRLIEVRQPFLKIEWFVYTYLAWNVASRGELHVDAGEQITVHAEPFEAVRQMSTRMDTPIAELRHILADAGDMSGLLQRAPYQGKEIEVVS